MGDLADQQYHCNAIVVSQYLRLCVKGEVVDFPVHYEGGKEKRGARKNQIPYKRAAGHMTSTIIDSNDFLEARSMRSRNSSWTVFCDQR